MAINLSEEQRHLFAVSAARKKLTAYSIGMWDKFQVANHHRVIGTALEKVLRGELLRSIITIPPRHGKSKLATENFSSWYLGHRPNDSVIIASYGQELASDFGRQVRNAMETPFYQAVFPGVTIAEDSSSNKRFHTNHGGALFAVGRGGTLTGRGANCFPAGTKVMTDHGPVCISSVHPGCRVLSFNHETHVLEWKAVVSRVGRPASAFVKIKTESGNQIEATPDHRIFTKEFGYREARFLNAGNQVFELRNDFRNKEEKGTLLLAGLCEPGTFEKDDRSQQSSIPTREAMHCRISENQTADHESRRDEVRRMQHGPEKAGCAPHGSEQTKQQDDESSNAVSSVSCEMAQMQRTTISVVEKVHSSPRFVYDIQVESNHNFFANGILVHNCIIIDDVFKNREDAQSENTRRMVLSWYKSTLRTRLAPGGAIVIVNTRWHQDDLIGHLLSELQDEDGLKWHHINMPAITEGKALWPERFSFDDLMQIKKDIGTYEFEALYQQNPTPAEGGLIKRNWLKFYRERPANIKILIQSWDMAFKDTDNSDYVVGTVWGLDGSNCYLLDMVRDRMDFVATKNALKALSAKHPMSLTKLVEDKANGSAIISELKNQIMGIKAFEPKGSKQARLSSVAPLFEAGNVHFPDPSIAPWVHDVVEEVVGFPYMKHDDIVDSVSQALLHLKEYSAHSLSKLITL